MLHEGNFVGTDGVRSRALRSPVQSRCTYFFRGFLAPRLDFAAEYSDASRFPVRRGNGLASAPPRFSLGPCTRSPSSCEGISSCHWKRTSRSQGKLSKAQRRKLKKRQKQIEEQRKQLSTSTDSAEGDDEAGVRDIVILATSLRQDEEEEEPKKQAETAAMKEEEIEVTAALEEKMRSDEEKRQVAVTEDETPNAAEMEARRAEEEEAKRKTEEEEQQRKAEEEAEQKRRAEAEAEEQKTKAEAEEAEEQKRQNEEEAEDRRKKDDEETRKGKEEVARLDVDRQREEEVAWVVQRLVVAPAATVSGPALAFALHRCLPRWRYAPSANQSHTYQPPSAKD